MVFKQSSNTLKQNGYKAVANNFEEYLALRESRWNHMLTVSYTFECFWQVLKLIIKSLGANISNIIFQKSTLVRSYNNNRSNLNGRRSDFNCSNPEHIKQSHCGTCNTEVVEKAISIFPIQNISNNPTVEHILPMWSMTSFTYSCNC